LQASSREVTLSQGWFLILGLITIIGLDLLPYVVAQAKIENDAPPENYTTLVTDSHYVNALTNKALLSFFLLHNLFHVTVPVLASCI